MEGGRKPLFLTSEDKLMMPGAAAGEREMLLVLYSVCVCMWVLYHIRGIVILLVSILRLLLCILSGRRQNPGNSMSVAAGVQHNRRNAAAAISYVVTN